MNIYSKYFFPHVVDCLCGLKPMSKQREKIVHEAEGIVLEIGIGSGLNVPFYETEKVKHLIGVDPAPNKNKLLDRLDQSGIDHEMIFQSAEFLPMDNQSIDTIVTTYTMCSIPDIDQTLLECKRVLKDKGVVIFIEHGLAPDEKIRKTQNRLNPFWKWISGGCNLNRDIPEIFRGNGFEIPIIESMYLPGWKPSTWNWWGKAHVS